MPASRFRDTGEEHADFLAVALLVLCPSCGSRAVLSPASGATSVGLLSRRRLACTCCATVREASLQDWLPELRPFLSVPCCGRELFAWNRGHLEFLESFVSARLRQRGLDGVRGRHNRSLASRLPAWIKDGGNREAVRAGLRKLRALLGDPPHGAGDARQ